MFFFLPVALVSPPSALYVRCGYSENVFISSTRSAVAVGSSSSCSEVTVIAYPELT
jgi:hypothetical protein